MKLKKIMKFILMSSLTLGLLTATKGVRLKAAEPVLTIDYVNQELTVEVPEDETTTEYIYLGVANGKDAVKTWDRIKAEKDADGSAFITVDISFYTSASKNYVFQAYTDSNIKKEIGKVTVGKQTKNLKISYTPIDTDKKVTVIADGNELDPTAFQFKTLYGGEWISGEELESNIDKYTLYGTTLVIQEKPVDGVKMASKEIKLKIPKRASGPKAALDASKLTVTIPANCEWRIIGEGITKREEINFSDSEEDEEEDESEIDSTIWTATSKNKDGWIESESKKTVMTIAELQKQVTKGIKIGTAQKDANILSEGVIIELRTPAKAKKPESKISFLKIPAQPDAPQAIAYTIVYNKTSDNKNVSSITFENRGNKALQLLIKDIGSIGNGADIDTSKAAFINIPAGRSKIFKKTALPDKVQIAIRYASIKQKNTKDIELASKFLIDTIEYPVFSEPETDNSKTNLK